MGGTSLLAWQKIQGRRLPGGWMQPLRQYPSRPATQRLKAEYASVVLHYFGTVAK